MNRSSSPDSASDVKPPVVRSNVEEGLSLLQVGVVLLRHRWFVAAAPVAVAFLFVAVTLVLPRSYTSTATLAPESGTQQALSGIAAQFGINVPLEGATQSPEFYADLLRSRALLKATAETRYKVDSGRAGGDSLSGDLVQLYEIEEPSRPLAVRAAVEQLRGQVDVQVRTETGVLALAVEAPWPELSRQLAERMVELINEFNLERRQLQAAEERKFLSQRLDTARKELRAVEDSLERFLEQNRSYQSSPTLRFEYQRLQRRVTQQEQVTASLAQSYEQARIEEVRTTPVITVVESPNQPVVPDRRYLLLKGLLGLLVGAALGIFWAFGCEVMKSAREEEPSQFDEYEHLKRQALAELRAVREKISGVLSRG